MDQPFQTWKSCFPISIIQRRFPKGGKENIFTHCIKVHRIKIHHIKAHTGLSDELSIGNEGADMLANLAINEESCPYKAYTNIDTFFDAHKKGLSYDKLLKPKNYLNIPYDKKDEAKELGALW